MLKFVIQIFYMNKTSTEKVGQRLRDIDIEAVASKDNEKFFNNFLNKNHAFIQKCIYKNINRYVTKSCDEWSIAVIAFSQAVADYNIDKGSFYSFSEQIISRRLIDYYRSQRKYSAEILVNPNVFDTDSEQDEDDISIQIEVSKKVSFTSDNSLRYEIEAANEVFLRFGFSFYELTNYSPKAKKTKTACAKAVKYILDNPILLNEIYHTKQLPLKIIEKNTKLPRKILDRHRKYIIAATEILSGEYLYLSEYMRSIREEFEK